MNERTDIEVALRASLAQHARQAPPADVLSEQIIASAGRRAPVREPRRSRQWRTWTLPLVAAGAMVAVAAALVGVNQFRHTADHKAPAAPNSSLRPAPGPTSGRTTSGPTSPPSGKSSNPAAGGQVRVPSGWEKHVDFAALPHPELDCRNALRGAVEVHSVQSADVTGDGAADALVRISCLASTSAVPDVVELYSDASGKPVRVATMLHQSDSLIVRKVAVAGRSVTLSEAGWSKFTPLCCPDLNYTQRFTWTGSDLTPGARQDVLNPCGDTALQVTASDAHRAVVIVFHNVLPQACTLTGYPGLDAVTATGQVLAHAQRTLSSAEKVSTVRVEPGQSASAIAEWTIVAPAGGSCAQSAMILVTPPGTQRSAQLPNTVGTCSLQIHPTVAGTTGHR